MKEDTATPAPITAVSNALINKDANEALWRIAKLQLFNVRYMKPGTKDYTMAVSSLAKIIADIQKLTPKELSDKEELLAELEGWLNDQ